MACNKLPRILAVAACASALLAPRPHLRPPSAVRVIETAPTTTAPVALPGAPERWKKATKQLLKTYLEATREVRKLTLKKVEMKKQPLKMMQKPEMKRVKKAKKGKTKKKNLKSLRYL